MALKETLLQAVKKAMQGEMDSVTLYQNAADHATDIEVKDFFRSRREEERLHYNYLLQYYQTISNDLNPGELSITLSTEAVNPIFSDDFIRRIGEDQYLFSAISTALLLEKDAFEHYRKCSLETDNPALKDFFGQLEKWELRHYDELSHIQKHAEVHYWQINHFEPF